MVIKSTIGGGGMQPRLPVLPGGLDQPGGAPRPRRARWPQRQQRGGNQRPGEVGVALGRRPAPIARQPHSTIDGPRSALMTPVVPFGSARRGRGRRETFLPVALALPAPPPGRWRPISVVAVQPYQELDRDARVADRVQRVGTLPQAPPSVSSTVGRVPAVVPRPRADPASPSRTGRADGAECDQDVARRPGAALSATERQGRTHSARCPWLGRKDAAEAVLQRSWGRPSRRIGTRPGPRSCRRHPPRSPNDSGRRGRDDPGDSGSPSLQG